MKQNITIKPKLKIKQTFNAQKNESLKVLAFNVSNLKEYLYKQAQTNPFLNFTSTQADTFLEYEHEQITLHDKINQELLLSNKTIPNDLVEGLIRQLDSNGYFKNTEFNLSYSNVQIQQAISILQRLEPYGCFSRDLKECLSIQCELSENPTSETGLILCDYLKDLATHNIQKIIDNTNLTYEEIEEGLHFIQTLNPKPAANYSIESKPLLPEIRVTYHEKFEFELINQDFSIQFEDMQNITEELKHFRQEAKQLLSAVQKRNITLLQIMDTLCQIQKDFFLKNGPIHYCTLTQVAKKCGLHTSTISRAIQQKSFEYNNKYYPIKHLFSHSGLKKMSSDTIKSKIKYIIDQEDKVHPYSDESIRKILLKENINISRRTITKYREQLLYFNASQRKEKK